MDIGFIGVGNIGFPMARRLLKAGHHLVVCDLNSAAVDRLQAEGATVAGSPADVANAASLVMASLPTPQSVKAVVGGDKGLVNGKVICCFVDLSTTGRTVAKEIAQLLENKGVVQIDAPVSGDVHGAEAGKLAVMASGPRQQFEFVEPILSNLGRVFFVGEAPGLGQAMKLVNNYLSAAAPALTSEARCQGRARSRQDDRGAQCRFGVQQRHRRQVSAVRPHRHLRLRLRGRPNVQDVSLFAQEAEKLGVPTWIGTMVRQMWQFTCSQMGPDADFTRIVQCNERWAGVEVPSRSTSNTGFQVSQPSWICAGPRLSKDIR